MRGKKIKTDCQIHKFRQGDYLIVVDVNSGAVHAVDELTFELLNFVAPPFSDTCPEEVADSLLKLPRTPETLETPSFDRAEIAECYEQLRALWLEGLLFSEGGYEKFAEAGIKAPLKAMCLHVAHDCNLRCEYCFASTGDFGTGREIMSPETGKAAVDFLISQCGERKNLEIDFFGGEPLLAWDCVTETVNYARGIEKERGKNFRFTITTNGLLLDEEKIGFINREMSNVVLSLDGRREVNDRMRRTSNDKGSYDIIAPKFKELLKTRVNENRTSYYIRGTFTAFNLDFTKDIASMTENGFHELSAEPVVTDPALPYAINTEHLPAVFSEYDRLFEIMNDPEKRRFNFFHFNIDLEQGPCAIKRLRGCGAGNEYVAVTPSGDIFPCHQFVGIKKWKMGNIKDNNNNNITNGGGLNGEIKTYFSKTHVYSKENCVSCWAKFYCGGGCNASGYLYEGDARKPHRVSCEMMKKRIECGIALKVGEKIRVL